MNSEQERIEAIAADYDSRLDFDCELIRFNYREMKPRLRGPAILELGCANGVMTRWLAEDFPILHVVDASARYIDEVSASVRSDVVFHRSLFQEFVCPRRFDDIVMARALEHLDDPVALLRAMQSWLEPGGRLHVVVPNAQSLHRRIGCHMGLLSRPDELGQRDLRFGHRRVYDTDLLRYHLRLSGWQVERILGVFLKPLSNAQMETFSPELIEGLYLVGQEFPLHCAELYATATVIEESHGKDRVC